MDQERDQFCPLCRAPVEGSLRYPAYLCGDCSRQAADENGRLLKFHNESFSGGFVAKYADTGEARDSHICFIRGVRCWADEAHMGGIVIRPVDIEAADPG